MTGKKAIQLAGAVALITAGGTAAALPFSSSDARSYAMGGAGVAAGNAASAVFLNPGLLALEDRPERYSMQFPVIGGHMSDPGNLADAIDDFNEVEPVGVFQDAVNAYIATPNAGTAAAVQASGDELIDELESISGDIVSAGADVAAVVGIPHEKYALSFFVDVNVMGSAVGEATDEDIAVIQQTIDDALNNQAITDPTDDLTSSARARFIRITETGVAIARNFDVLGGIAVGVTPKLVSVRTSDYLFVGSEIDTAEVSSDPQESDFGLNLDVGVAKKLGDNWRLGLAVRNLLSREYETVLDNTLKVGPMARLGVAYSNSCLTLASDLDLTENESTGYEPKTRYASLGAELYLFELFHIRLGYRRNLSDDVPAGTETDIMMAGLGFSSERTNVDIAAAGNGDEFGAALQFGFRF